jgi:hypothetical protein
VYETWLYRIFYMWWFCSIISHNINILHVGWAKAESRAHLGLVDSPWFGEYTIDFGGHATLCPPYIADDVIRLLSTSSLTRNDSLSSASDKKVSLDCNSI